MNGDLLEKLAGRSLIILIPSYDDKITLRGALALVDTDRALSQFGIKVLVKTSGHNALIADARNELLHTALLSDPSDILFVDADIVWKPEDVVRLLYWAADREIVAAAYPMKQDAPVFHTNLLRDAQGRLMQDHDGLLRAVSVPAGFMMLDPMTLRRVSASLPQYRVETGTMKGQFITEFFAQAIRGEHKTGEDVEFCLRMADCGVSIWVDPLITLTHTGAKDYRHSYDDFLRKPPD